MTLLLLVSIAGGFGAVARLLLDELISAARQVRFPLAIAAINVSGSLALGLLAGVTLRYGFAPHWQLVLGTGFLGGYTTFSTASVQTVQLAREHRPLMAAAYGFGVLIVSVALATLGLWLGSR
jgi:fluoride exporter